MEKPSIAAVKINLTNTFIKLQSVILLKNKSKYAVVATSASVADWRNKKKHDCMRIQENLLK